jgi:hypothetical protein
MFFVLYHRNITVTRCCFYGCDVEALGTVFLLLFLSVGPAESRLALCNLSRLIVLSPLLVPTFISRGAPRRTA